MIGDESVKSTVVDGRIVGDRIMAISNELYVIHAEWTPIGQSSGNPEASVPEEPNSGPCLHLLMSTGTGPAHFGGEFRLSGAEPGSALIAAGTIRPSLQNQPGVPLLLTNWYAIGSAADGSKMVLMEGALLGVFYAFWSHVDRSGYSSDARVLKKP